MRVRKRSKTFIYIFEAGKIDGKREVIKKAEAYTVSVAVYNDFLHGNIGIESISLKDFMTTWLENVVVANIKPITFQEYRTRFQKHIMPMPFILRN